jgi:thiol-disulfide isomerase/thioredoxin
MKKYLFKIFILSLIINLIIAPLRGGYVNIGSVTGFKLSSIVGAIIYYVFIYYSLKKANGKLHSGWILFSVIFGMLFLTLPIHIMNFKGTLVSALEPVIHIFAVLCGYLFFKSNLCFKVLTCIISIICCACLSTKGYDLWIHKLAFDTFTGKIEVTNIPDFQFINEQNDTFCLSDFSEKYTVVDFWFTGCGICFRKFPQVQTLYDTYKENSSVAVISINARLKGESDNIAFETIQREGYSFPVYRLDMDNPILAELGVVGYPTVILFDKEGNAIFRGNIESVSDHIDKLLRQKSQYKEAKRHYKKAAAMYPDGRELALKIEYNKKKL